jgi:AcrR family transcriptional regulator
MITDADRLPKVPREPLDASGVVVRNRAVTNLDQRARLLRAAVETAARTGYANAKVGDIAVCAGVSRATFYELFESKARCLLSAQRALAGELGEEVELAVARGDAARAAQSGLSALVAFAQREPLGFDFLMHESMLAGPEAMAERDRLMARLVQTIERAWQRAPTDAAVLDMSAKMLLEGSVRLLGLRMRRDADPPISLLPELLAWFDYYTVGPGVPRWRELAPRPALVRAAPKTAVAGTAHRALPRARRRMAADAAKKVQRERIAYATAEAIREKGYANITVADIVADAGISRDVFYAHFHDKQGAFEAATQLLFEQLLATMAGAFFGSSGTWPEQVWEAGRAFVRFLESDPILANFLFVGTYAPPMYIERVHEFVLAFTVFVEHGNRHEPRTPEIPRIVSEAIVCSVLEAVTFQVRHERVKELWGLIPLVTYMVFAPFMGPQNAADFVEAKVGDAEAGIEAQAAQ